LQANSIGRSAHWFSPLLFWAFPDGPDNIDRLAGSRRNLPASEPAA
jgi:hypothetical protein